MKKNPKTEQAECTETNAKYGKFKHNNTITSKLHLR